MTNHHQPVAKEGYLFIGLFGSVTLVLALLGWTVPAFLLLALTLFTIYFFRNPERHAPQDPNAVVSPADGRVVFVGEVDETRFVHTRMLKVSVFMSVFNVHINRVPFAGKVVDLFHEKGSFLNAALDKASECNECCGMLMETSSGQRFLVVQVAGLIARRIVCYPHIGMTLEKGMRYGLIRFGSRVDLYLPPNWQVNVRPGDKVVGGETLIGYAESEESSV